MFVSLAVVSKRPPVSKWFTNLLVNLTSIVDQFFDIYTGSKRNVFASLRYDYIRCCTRDMHNIFKGLPVERRDIFEGHYCQTKSLVFTISVDTLLLNSYMYIVII